MISERKGIGYREPYMGAIIEISEALIEAAAKDATIANVLNGMKLPTVVTFFTQLTTSYYKSPRGMERVCGGKPPPSHGDPQS